MGKRPIGRRPTAVLTAPSPSCTSQGARSWREAFRHRRGNGKLPDCVTSQSPGCASSVGPALFLSRTSTQDCTHLIAMHPKTSRSCRTNSCTVESDGGAFQRNLASRSRDSLAQRYFFIVTEVTNVHDLLVHCEFISTVGRDSDCLSLWDETDWNEMKRKIFVVDDEQQIAILLSEVLRAADFDVETFYDASSALRRAMDGQPNILVTDVTMPDMDGITLAIAIRAQLPNCRIILISGYPNWKADTELQKSGLNDFALLLKPFSITHLMRLVKAEVE